MTGYIVFCEAFYCKLTYDDFLFENLCKIKEAKKNKNTAYLEKYSYLNIFLKQKDSIKAFYTSGPDESIDFN